MKKFAVMAASLSAAVLAGKPHDERVRADDQDWRDRTADRPVRRVRQLRDQWREDCGDEINAKGGVLGQKIELVIEDNKSNPTEAASVAEKLMVRDKVPVLMGAWGSSLTLAVMPKLMEYKGADAGRDFVVRQDHDLR
jgi:hypothetical protein